MANNIFQRMKLPEYKSFEEKAPFFAPEDLSHGYPFVIDTPEEFDQLYDTLQKEHNSSNHLLFRGVSEAKFQNFTSVQRLWLTNKWEEGFTFDMLVERGLQSVKEKSILKEYLSSLNVQPNDFYYLTFLQHFGAPTPMLDFSHNLNVGLYFAFDNSSKVKKLLKSDKNIDNYTSLYLYDIAAYQMQVVNLIDMLADSFRRGVEMVNDFNLKNPGVHLDISLLSSIDSFSAWKNPQNGGDGVHKVNIGLLDNSIRGNQVQDITGNKLFWSNIRIIAQNGCLMVYPNEKIPLEKYLSEQIHIPLRCFNIHKSLKTHVMSRINLSKDLIYPNEESIAKAVRNYMESNVISPTNWLEKLLKIVMFWKNRQ